MTSTLPAPTTAPKPAGKQRSHKTGGLPLLLLLPALFGLAFLIVPLLGLVLEAPWGNLVTELSHPSVFEALKLSVVCATAATVVCLLLGVPMAWLLARSEIPGKKGIRSLVTVPMVLPPVVGGVALLIVLGRNGLIGQYLNAWFGISLPFTTAGVIVAEAFVSMPFLVISVDGALRSADRRYEEAAASLGASRWLTFRSVTLPIVAPGIAAGTMLCWARALGEFGATITFAGNFPGKTQTMPLAVYIALETDPDAAIVLSLVLLAVSIIVLASLRDKWINPKTA
ncbi:MAG: molybdate ABC transporter permease subunit [Pseudonocardiaceae bacterium]